MCFFPIPSCLAELGVGGGRIGTSALTQLLARVCAGLESDATAQEVIARVQDHGVEAEFIAAIDFDHFNWRMPEEFWDAYTAFLHTPSVQVCHEPMQRILTPLGEHVLKGDASPEEMVDALILAIDDVDDDNIVALAQRLCRHVGAPIDVCPAVAHIARVLADQNYVYENAALELALLNLSNARSPLVGAPFATLRPRHLVELFFNVLFGSKIRALDALVQHPNRAEVGRWIREDLLPCPGAPVHCREFSQLVDRHPHLAGEIFGPMVKSELDDTLNSLDPDNHDHAAVLIGRVGWQVKRRRLLNLVFLAWLESSGIFAPQNWCAKRGRQDFEEDFSFPQG